MKGIDKLKKEYDEKLENMLRIQEVNLRAEMNDKLASKDLELKKMIAELEQKMMSRTAAPTGSKTFESDIGRNRYR